MGGRSGRLGGRGAVALVASLAALAAVLPRSARAAQPRAGTFKPAANVTGTIWTYGPGFIYPELSDSAWGIPELKKRPSFGIAVRGDARARAGRGPRPSTGQPASHAAPAAAERGREAALRSAGLGEGGAEPPAALAVGQ